VIALGIQPDQHHARTLGTRWRVRAHDAADPTIRRRVPRRAPVEIEQGIEGLERGLDQIPATAGGSCDDGLGGTSVHTFRSISAGDFPRTSYGRSPVSSMYSRTPNE